MFGVPANHFPIFLEGEDGYVLAIDFNLLRLKTVNSVIATNAIDKKLYEASEELSLEDLIKQINNPSKEVAFYNSGDSLYILLKRSVLPYSFQVKIVVAGIRSSVPIKSEDDYIDIPEKYLELFIYYTAKYACVMKGKRVPSDIEIAINNLENKFKKEL